jgi:hypothetical protein
VSHQCPADGCDKAVGDQMLMCANDWRRVPGPVKKAVWKAWDKGAGAGTRAHRAALAAAIRAVNRQPRP